MSEYVDSAGAEAQHRDGNDGRVAAITSALALVARSAVAVALFATAGLWLAEYILGRFGVTLTLL